MENFPYKLRRARMGRLPAHLLTCLLAHRLAPAATSYRRVKTYFSYPIFCLLSLGLLEMNLSLVAVEDQCKSLMEHILVS